MTRVLILPGWLNSPPEHWQSRWEAAHGFERVQQADWTWPRRGDWMARLDEALLEHPAGEPGAPGEHGEPGATREVVVLVAHSLGCHLVAAWSAHSQHTARVQAALLVAPPDTERPDMPPQLHGWRHTVRQPLPFRAQVLYSADDPYASAERAQGLAADWGASALCVGARGHINGESGLGDWPEGLACLHALIRPEKAGS